MTRFTRSSTIGRSVVCYSTASLLAAVGLSAPAAAQISITNGDFETGGGANIADVTSWFDNNTGGFFEGAWQSNAQSFNGTNQVVFSSFESDDFGIPSPTVLDGSYLYQGVGTAAGATSLELEFDWGAPTDDDINRDLGLTVAIYADTTGSFVGVDGTDVNGVAGLTLLDSETFTSAAGTRPAGGTMFTNVLTSLDLTGAGTNQLYLRFNGYLPTTTESWPTLDNVGIFDPNIIAWNVDADGNYGTGSNWSGGVAPGANADVEFGSAITANREVTLTSNVTINTATFNNGAGDYFIVPAAAQTLTLTGLATIDVAGGRHWSRANIAGTSGANFTGGGEFILDADNSFSGGLNVDNANLGITHADAIPTGNAISIVNGGQVQIWGPENQFFIDNGATLVSSLTLSNPISIDATSSFHINNGAAVNVTGVISGAGTVDVFDAPATLSAANTYTGVTNVSGDGVLTPGNNAALGAGGTGASGTVVFGDQNTSSVALTGGRTIANEVLRPGARQNATIDAPHLTSAGTNAWNGNILGELGGTNYNFLSTSGTLTLGGTLSAPDTGVRNFVFDGAGNFSVALITDGLADADGNFSVISLEDNVNVIKRGTGTLTVTTATDANDDFWSGTTTIQAGTVVVQDDGLDNGELRSDVTVNAGAFFDIDDFATYNLLPTTGLEVGIGGGGTVIANTLGAFESSTITPGDSVGTLKVNGNMTLTYFDADAAVVPNSGSLNYELGDDASINGVDNAENDLIRVNGTLTTTMNAGTTANQFVVNVTPVDGFLDGSPNYTLMSATTRNGNATAANFAVNVVNPQGTAVNSRQNPTVVLNGTSVQVGFTPNQTYTWNGNANNTWDVDGALNWTSSDQQFMDLDRVTFGATGQGTVDVAGPVTPGQMTVAAGTSYSFTGGAIQGSANLNVNGTLALNNDDSFVKTATVANGGTLDLQRDGYVLAGNVVAQNGSTLRVGGDGLPSGQALNITNGDFEAGVPDEVHQADIPSWFDFNGANFFDNAWVLSIDGISYNDTAMMALSGFAADETTNAAGLNAYAYQSLGTDAGATGLDVTFDWGSFEDAPGPRDLGITVGVYESTGAFVPDDATDLLGGAGVTLLDEVSLTQAAVAVGGNFPGESVSLDISGQSGGELFIRINNFETATGAPNDESWIGVDNLTLAVTGGTASVPIATSATVDGDVTLSATSTLSLDIAGSGVNDLLSVTGNLAANGTLEVLLDATVSALEEGDTYDLLDFGSVTGTFANLDLPTLGSGLDWDTTSLLVDGIISVINVGGIFGDYNDSGQVEQGDLDFVLQNWGDTDISDVAGWVNFAGLPGGGIDGQVEQTELDLVLTNWGDTTAPDFAGSAVPEPAAVALLGLGGVALLGRRRG